MAYGAFWFSLMSLLVKVAGQSLPSQQIVLVRGVVTLVLSYALLRRAGIRVWGNRRKLLLLRGALGFIGLSLYYFSLVHLPLADATAIQYTNPVFAVVLAALLLRERAGLAEVLVVLVSLTGVVLITRPSFLFGGAARLDPRVVALALTGAFCSATVYVMIRKLTDEHPLVIVFYLPLVTVLGTLPLMGVAATWPTAFEWVVLAGVGVTTQIAQVYMTRGLQLEPAGRATAVGYLQLVFAGLWGALFFRELPDAWSLVGTVMIVGGTLVLAVWRGRGERPSAQRAQRRITARTQGSLTVQRSSQRRKALTRVGVVLRALCASLTSSR